GSGGRRRPRAPAIAWREWRPKMCQGLGLKRRAAQRQEQKRGCRRSESYDSYGIIEPRMDADEHGFTHGTVGWATFSFPSPRPHPGPLPWGEGESSAVFGHA